MRMIRENQWATIFEEDSGAIVTKSRFLDEAFTVSAQEVIHRWALMSEHEQLEFLRAFGVRPKLNAQDQEILDFLMGINDKKVWVMISRLMVKHADRNRAVKFLLETIQQNSEGLANCYQALGLINDLRALPVLLLKLKDYNDRFASAENAMSKVALIDYVACCAAVKKLDPTKHDECMAVLMRLGETSHESVRFHVARALNTTS